MRLSSYFLPLLKEVPSEATIISHRLMLRAGMIRQICAGLYNWLPLGTKLLHKVSDIIHQELQAAGCLEILMPCIQPAELWQESGRSEAYGKEMLRIKDRHENQLLFGPTNEEVVTDIFRNNIFSYKDLPKNLYNIQWKFRDEMRPRSGIMRGREFLMKDGYSFDIDAEGAKISYNKIYQTYLKIFKRMGINAVPIRAATGAIGGDLSHEFHVIAQNGDSDIYYDKYFDTIYQTPDLDTINIEEIQKLYSAADEMHDPVTCSVAPENLNIKRGIEVGHIFYFATKYSVSMKANVTNHEGKLVPVEMCSYGIGVSRLIAAIIEASHDDKGIIWPKTVAPFALSLINLRSNDPDCTSLSDDLYQLLQQNTIEVLYDDTENSPGAKFATHDLIGMPWQVLIGPKVLKDGMVELKNRLSGKIEVISIESFKNNLSVFTL